MPSSRPVVFPFNLDRQDWYWLNKLSTPEYNLTFRILARLEKILKFLKTEAQLAKYGKHNITKEHKAYYLKENLKRIKIELGIDRDVKDALIGKFQTRLNGKTVPQEVQSVIYEELEKITQLEPHHHDYVVTKNYLDWLTEMPWGVFSEEPFDIVRAEQILNEDHYGLVDVKDRILEFIAVGKLRGEVPKGKILCLVGPPGTGKTSVGASIARALGRKFYRFSVGGMADVSMIKGHRRTYVGALPGKLIQCLKIVRTQNPVILIDELDKIGTGYRGDPASALLEVLDPQQNSNFSDQYLDVPMDLSKVLFICTANDDATIPAALRDRMEFIRLSGYTDSEKMKIALNYLSPSALKESGLPEGGTILYDDAILSLIKWYCREAGVRNLEKHIQKIYRKAALRLVRETPEPGGGGGGMIEIHEEDLEDLVGKRKFTREKVYEHTPAGVVLGLAWNSLGGTTIYIETAAVEHRPEKGGLKRTGRMGQVMEESSTIAHSFAKHFLLQLVPTSTYFDDTKIHLHIPEGAIPKDGPSAGVAMVTAFLSLALNKSVRANLAMTGEITLTGKILAVGGIKEKAMAAQREGVENLVLPAANEPSFDELDEELKSSFTVHFAGEYEEVFAIAFAQTLPCKQHSKL